MSYSRRLRANNHIHMTRSAIESVRKENNIKYEQFHEFGKLEWQSVYHQLSQIFVPRGVYPDGRTLYQCWKYWEEDYEVLYAGENYLDDLNFIIPSHDKVVLLAEEGSYGRKEYWLYEGYVDAVYRIIHEAALYNYMIASKKYNWILAETQEGFLYGKGEPVVSNMISLSKRKKR
ncbi:DUF6756 family protein [Paenibacillus kandeliae]|uniref:DUF6756 family protein n=1 Tax=Paenibacillus kandeliae TaxID=3231269 RepID=UPI003459F641